MNRFATILSVIGISITLTALLCLGAQWLEVPGLHIFIEGENGGTSGSFRFVVQWVGALTLPFSLTLIMLAILLEPNFHKIYVNSMAALSFLVAGISIFQAIPSWWTQTHPAFESEWLISMLIKLGIMGPVTILLVATCIVLAQRRHH